MKATETRNFAHYGVFVTGHMVDYGHMVDMMFAANSFSLQSEERVTLSTIRVSDEDDLKEGTEIMCYRNVNGVVYVTNSLSE